MGNKRESAEELALRGLAWLAADDAIFGAFMAASGCDAGLLRRRAAEPEVLASVLDFLLADEALLMRFCAEAGVPPQAPLQARAALPGGEAPHWT